MRGFAVICLVLAGFCIFQLSAQSSGSCWCLSGTNVNVRSSACGSVIGSTGTGSCYTATGRSSSCYLSGTRYTYYELNYGSTRGWIANTLLTSGGNACGGGSSSGTLTHAQAMSRLNQASIPVVSTDNCSNRYVTTCTSLDSIRTKCIDDIIEFKETSGCSVKITGGTEKGHSTSITMSHWNGYKLDISLSSCLYKYIVTEKDSHGFTYLGIRNDDAPMYRDRKGNVYAKESNHWDIQFP